LPRPWRPVRLEQGKRITDIALNISLESLEQLSGGRVYGGVHLQLAGARFPSGEWTDFVAVVLSFLCDGLAKVLAGPDQSVDVRFMEGPFAVRLGPIASSKIVIGLLDNTSSSAVADSTEIHLESLMRTALKATRAVVDECRSRGFSSTDVEQLIASREQLVRAFGAAAPG
jgi:hypothetical protein